MNLENKTALSGNTVHDLRLGRINPLTLHVTFDENKNQEDYSRRQNTETYIVVTGAGAVDVNRNTLYYYYKNADDYGFCTESGLKQKFGDSLYIKVTLSGFFENKKDNYKEGFNPYDNPEYEYHNFLIDNSKTGNVNAIEFITANLLSWYDTERNIYAGTSAASGRYRLEIDSGARLTNYVLEGDNYVYLFIEKQKITTQVKKLSNDNRYEYNGQSQLSVLFDSSTGLISVDNHPEYEYLFDSEIRQITDAVEKRERQIEYMAEHFLQLESFSFYDASYSGEFSAEDQKSFKYAGSYTFSLHLPATTNFEAFVLKDIEAVIDTKTVMVYLTYATRLYMDDHISYGVNYANVTTPERVRVDSDGKIITDGEGGNLAYAYLGSIDIRYILYSGFIDGDYMDPDAGDVLAWAQEPEGEEKVGSHKQIVAMGAVKPNYKFQYVSTAIYIRPKPLTFNISEVQSHDFTGRQIELNYSINNGENDAGTLKFYILGYKKDVNSTITESDYYEEKEYLYDDNKNPIYDANGQQAFIDRQTRTDVKNAGHYILQTWAIPKDGSANYTVSQKRPIVDLKVYPTEVVLAKDNFDSQTPAEHSYHYTGEAYGQSSLKNFDYYFVGKSSLISDKQIDALVSWGSVTLIGAKKIIKEQHENADPTTTYLLIEKYNEIMTVGEYIYTIKAKFSDDLSENLYFSVGGVTGTNECTFDLRVDIKATESYTFNIIKPNSSSVDEESGNLVMTYNGNNDSEKDSKDQYLSFNYTLNFLGEDIKNGKINVITTIKRGGDEYVYAVNGKIKMRDVQKDIDDVNNITERIPNIIYDNISQRPEIKDVGNYIIKFYVNNPNSSKYNENYCSFEKSYVFTIIRKPIAVILEFDEKDFTEETDSPIPYKVYNTPNADLVAKAIKNYNKYDVVPGDREAFANNAETFLDLVAIDTSLLPENAPVISNSCYIGTKENPDNSAINNYEIMKNYYFDYSADTARRIVAIIGAKSRIIVYCGAYFTAQGAEYAENIIKLGNNDSDKTFDKIYHYQTTEGVKTVEEYTDFNLNNADVSDVLNRYYYYDYCVYNGVKVEPCVLRYIVENNEYKPLDPEKEYADAKIELVGMFIGKDKNNINPVTDIAYGSSGMACKDVGEYVFRVSVNASPNYSAIEPAYFYLKIVKNNLNLNILSYNSQSKVYDGIQGNYPVITAKYIGFVGDDAEEDYYGNVQSLYHKSEFDADNAHGISALGLVNPYYEIVKQNDNDKGDPVNVGTYRLRLELIDGQYGYSKNYNILVNYDWDIYGEILPMFTITPRPIDIATKGVVEKEYDATDKLVTRKGEVKLTAQHYTFTACEGIEQSGMVSGDTVNLKFDLDKSCYMRTTVYDSNGIDSDIVIKVYFNVSDALTNRNYTFAPSKFQFEGAYTYIEFKGKITPAEAVMTLYSDEEPTDDSKIEANSIYSVVFNNKSYSIYRTVKGVRKSDDIDDLEQVKSKLTYQSEAGGQPSEVGPVLVGTYIVELTIDDSNYKNDYMMCYLKIEQAELSIIFGGDNQTYGSVTGLGAIAVPDFEVANYPKTLTVVYYDEEDNFVENIAVAHAGTYKAVAIFEGDYNFKEKTETEEFVIARRDMHISYNQDNAPYYYSGSPTVIDIYFIYDSEKQSPHLEYRDSSGEIIDAAIAVGEYSVKVINDMRDFNILDEYEIYFSVEKINAKVKVADAVLIYGSEEYEPKYVLTGTAGGDDMRAVFDEMPKIRYYSTDINSSASQDTAPSAVGVYKVELYGGVSSNYNIVYESGILTINQKELAQEIVDSKNNVIGNVNVIGSFGSGVSAVVNTGETLEYNQYVTAYESARLSNENLLDFNVFDVYSVNLSNGSITSSDGGMIMIKFPAKYYFDVLGEDYTGEYTVASIDAEGNVTLLSAVKDGDDLVIQADKLGTFMFLTPNDESANTTISSSKGNYDWILYVGIAVGVVLVGVAIIIVKVKE